jgi:hypothetical protein
MRHFHPEVLFNNFKSVARRIVEGKSSGYLMFIREPILIDKLYFERQMIFVIPSLIPTPDIELLYRMLANSWSRLFKQEKC